MAGQHGGSVESQHTKILKEKISKLSGLIQKEKERRALKSCQSNALTFSSSYNRFSRSSPISSCKTFRSRTHSPMCYTNSKFTRNKTSQSFRNSVSTSKIVPSDNSQSPICSTKVSSDISKTPVSTKIPCSNLPSSSSSSLISSPSLSSAPLQSNSEVSSLASTSFNKSKKLSEAKSKMVKTAQEDLVKTEARLKCLKTTYAKLCSAAPLKKAAGQNATLQRIEPKSTNSSFMVKTIETISNAAPVKQPLCLKNLTRSQIMKLSPILTKSQPNKLTHKISNVKSHKSWIKSSAKKIPVVSTSQTSFLPQSTTVTPKPTAQSIKSTRYSPLAQHYKYKFVRKAGVKKPATPLAKASKVLKPNTLTTPFKLIKSHSTSTPVGVVKKSGYSYFSSNSLSRARALNRGANPVICKDYKSRLAALLIDYGRITSSKVRKEKTHSGSVCCTPNKKSLVKTNIPSKFKMKVDHRQRLSRKYSLNLRLKSPFSFSKTPLRQSCYQRTTLASKHANFSKFSNLKTITVRGVKFHVEAGGKTLRRMETKLGSGSASCLIKVKKLNIGGVKYIQAPGGMLKRVDNSTVIMANRAVSKSIATAAARLRKDYRKPAQKPCLFYNRFGKCNKGSKCPFVHDPKKIAICYRMIRGGCKVENCPFYHQLSKEKMPSCSYFLKGQCNRENCIYPHVKVNKNAIICEDFLNGYCSLGEKCTEKHSLVCQKYRESQVCSHHACKFNSRKRKATDIPDKNKMKKINTKSSSAARNPGTKKNSLEDLASLSFISLHNSSDDSLMDTSGSVSNDIKSNQETLRIKPRL
ncbi:zinc finger CCCH domain-containing protein 3-like [Argonauta hians]